MPEVNVKLLEAVYWAVDEVVREAVDEVVREAVYWEVYWAVCVAAHSAVLYAVGGGGGELFGA